MCVRNRRLSCLGALAALCMQRQTWPGLRGSSCLQQCCLQAATCTPISMLVTTRFAGCLHNLSELARRRSKRSARSSAASPHFAADPNNAFPSSLERKSSIERSMDLGAMTASTVLGLYLDGQQEGNELIMLSELQVSF